MDISNPESTAPEIHERDIPDVAPAADIWTEPRTVAFPCWPGHHKPEWSITYEWVIATDDDGTELLAELACHHDGPYYAAYINNVRREPNGDVTSAERYPILIQRATKLPSPLFAEFAERALAELRSSTDRPTIAAYLRGRRPVSAQVIPKERIYDARLTPRQLRQFVDDAAGARGSEQDVEVAITHECVLTLASLRAAAAWATDPYLVYFLVDNTMLIAYQGGHKMAWDTDGSPASQLYLQLCPLDR